MFLNRFQSLQNPTMRRQSQTYASQHTKPRGQLLSKSFPRILHLNSSTFHLEKHLENVKWSFCSPGQSWMESAGSWWYAVGFNLKHTQSVHRHLPKICRNNDDTVNSTKHQPANRSKTRGTRLTWIPRDGCNITSFSATSEQMSRTKPGKRHGCGPYEVLAGWVQRQRRKKLRMEPKHI